MKQMPEELLLRDEVYAVVGAAILCYGSLLVEIKAAEYLTSRDQSQLLNYLKATGLKVGVLINFGRTKCEFKRLVM